MSMRFALAFAALLFVPAAAADVGVFAFAPTHAQSNTVVSVRADAWSAARRPHPPMYLVPWAGRPRPHPCRLRNGARASCEASSAGPPHRAGFVKINTLRWRRGGRFNFRVPRLSPGRYAFVVYCPPCMRGPRGSLIPSSSPLRVE